MPPVLWGLWSRRGPNLAYSDGALADAILRQVATELAILDISNPRSFHPLYSYLENISMSRNFNLFPRCQAVNHARVGRKIRGVNDAELPCLEGCHAGSSRASQNFPTRAANSAAFLPASFPDWWVFAAAGSP